MAKGMNPFAKMAKGKGKGMDPKEMAKQKASEAKKQKKK